MDIGILSKITRTRNAFERTELLDQLGNEVWEHPTKKNKEIAIMAARMSVADPNEMVRFESAYLICHYGSRHDLFAIRQLLKDKSWSVREWAACGLGAIGNRRDRELLWKVLAEDGDEMVRGSTADAIALHGDDRDIERLSAFLQIYDDEITRVCILCALMMLDAIQFLDEFLGMMLPRLSFKQFKISSTLDILWDRHDWIKDHASAILDAIIRYREAMKDEVDRMDDFKEFEIKLNEHLSHQE